MTVHELPSAALPLELAQKTYCTQSLIDLFTALKEDGYSGLGLGLIIDLIDRDAHAA